MDVWTEFSAHIAESYSHYGVGVDAHFITLDLPLYMKLVYMIYSFYPPPRGLTSILDPHVHTNTIHSISSRDVCTKSSTHVHTHRKIKHSNILRLNCTASERGDGEGFVKCVKTSAFASKIAHNVLQPLNHPHTSGAVLTPLEQPLRANHPKAILSICLPAPSDSPLKPCNSC